MFPLEEGFGEPWFPISTTGLIILLAAVAFGGLAGVLFLGTILEAVAAAGDGDQLGVVEQSVEDGAGCGNIAEQLAPFFNGPIGGHHGGAVLIPAHDDLEEYFAALGRQDLQAHVVDDQQIGFEIAGQEAGFTHLGLFFQEFAHQVEHGAVEDEEPGFDGLSADGLGKMAFAYSGRSYQ